MDHGKRASSVPEAAYTHLLVFTEPVGAWPPAMEARVPPFEQLYVTPPGDGKRAGLVAGMAARLRQVDGPLKLILTGQRGSGKSWALHHLGTVLADAFRIIPVSATDRTGTTLADAEIADLVVLLCEALAHEVPTGWRAAGLGNISLNSWVSQLKRLDTLVDVPTTTDGVTAELSAGFAKLSARMRSDVDTRRKVREVGADDLVVVANEMLDAISQAGRPPLVLFDDLDKVSPASAARIFGDQFSVVARVDARMVLTLPFSMSLENFLPHRVDTLRNVKVKNNRHDPSIRPEARERFVDLLGRLVDLELVDGAGVDLAVEYSGGITREFGRLLARAFENAALSGDAHVELAHVEDAVRDLRIELVRATSDAIRRAGLMNVRRGRKLDTEIDRSLLNENMVVEYVNGLPWYDVHPLLGEVVDSWLKPTA